MTDVQEFMGVLTNTVLEDSTRSDNKRLCTILKKNRASQNITTLQDRGTGSKQSTTYDINLERGEQRKICGDAVQTLVRPIRQV